MIRHFTCICAALLTFSGPALAGEPIEETVTCPIGGESFIITATASCSTMGRTMSFGPLTTCDFVTRLPVCPGNGLPMYQDFSDEQISKLTSFLETEDFQVLMALPPWQRAYGVARHLGQSGTDVAFSIVVSALWFESEEFFGNATFIDHFLRELDKELLRSGDEIRPFLNATAAYALSVAGRFDEANEKLNNAGTAHGSEYLMQYIQAIKACQPDMTQEGCRPQDGFDP